MRWLVVALVVSIVFGVSVEADAQVRMAARRASAEFTVAGWAWPAGAGHSLAVPVPSADARDGLWMASDGRIDFRLTIEGRPYVVSGTAPGFVPLHIAVTADRNTLTLYLSGRQAARASLPQKRPSITFDVAVAFEGSAVFDRALSARDIAALASNPPPPRLSVVSTAPEAGAGRVPLTLLPEVIFSDGLEPGSVIAEAIVVRDGRGAAVGGTLTYEPGRRAVRFTPLEPFLPTHPYTMRVASGGDPLHVRSIAGAVLPEAVVIPFVTTMEPPRIAAGDVHAAVIDGEGQVWTWGGNDAGQLGRGGIAELPSRVEGAGAVTTIAAGARHTLAVRADGRILAWGSNFRGQLGTGALAPSTQSIPIEVPLLSNVVAVAAGLFTSVALCDDGSVWTWGLVSGLGSLNGVQLTPVQVPGLPSIAAIAAGGAHVLAQAADGHVWSWGSNVFGQLGDGTLVNSTSPLLLPLSNIVGIAAGTASSLAVTRELRLLAWGRAEDGVTLRALPQVIENVEEVRHVAAGLNVTVVLGLEGSVQAWGSGAAGDGGDWSSPAGVAELSRGWQVAAGGASRLALDRNGVLLTWGRSSPLVELTEPGFVWKAAMPTFSHPSGTYSTELSLTLRSATAGAVVRFTTDGSEPDELSAMLPADGTIPIDRTTTVRARAWASGQPPSDIATVVLTMKLAAPAFSPAGGIFLTPPTVFMTASAGATIHMTVDGTDPDAASPQYTGPFHVVRSQTVRARALRDGWMPSETSIATYQLHLGTLASPVMSPPPGAYEEQVVVTLGAVAGATVHYTSDGSTPVAASPAYSGPLTVASTTTIRAVATAPDYADSPEVMGTYQVTAARPVIAPASGTYNTAQTVSMTTPTFSGTIRYTLDGTEPGPAATLYHAPFTVALPTVIRARSFRDGLEPSAISVSELSFRAPDVNIAPGSGIYLPGLRVTLSTAAEAEIRFTLDGSEPSSTSPLYSAPLELVSSATVRAMAFKPGWLPGAEARADFVVSTDIAGPNVTATVSPAAGAGGWHRDSVTVTFTCADQSAVVFCTGPQTVTGEGNDIEVRGHGRDAIGNVTVVRVPLKIDRTPPLLSLFTPSDGQTLPPGTTVLTLSGAAFDASGISNVACEGGPANVEGQRFSCELPVADGENKLLVTVEDLVGLVTTRELIVHVGDGPPPAAIRITPAQAVLGIGEVREPQVIDDRGRVVSVHEWTLNADGVVSMTQVDGVWTLEALAAGRVEVTAHHRGLTAAAQLEVMATGVDVPPGTVLWTARPTSAPGRATVLPAAPGVGTDPRRTASIFYIDEGSVWSGTTLVKAPDTPVVVTAVTAEGRELWTHSFDTAAALKHAASEPGGGVVLVWDQWFDEPSGTFHPPAVQRLDGATGKVTWEYRPYPNAFLSEAAVHPDGRTLFTEERLFGVSNLIAVSPAGAATAWVLPAGRQTTFDAGEAAMDADFPTPALATQPIIMDDGTVVLVAKTTRAIRYVKSRFDGEAVVIDTDTTRLPEVATDLHVLRLSDAGLSDRLVVGGSFAAIKPDQYRLLPDGHGGLLLGHRSDPHVIRVDAADRFVAARSLLPDGGGYTYGHEYVIGNDAAMLLTHAAVSGGTLHSSSEVAFDAETLVPSSTTTIVSDLLSPSDLRLQFAREGGGIQLSGPGSAAHATQVTEGLFAAWSAGPSLITGSPIARAQTEWAAPSGTERGSHVAFHAGVGIFLKSHEVVPRALHASIRLVPRNQPFWVTSRPAAFINVDSRGMRFATIGAGPGGDDSGAACDGSLTLISDLNRARDVSAPAFSVERLVYAPHDEDAMIARLLERDAAYRDHLKYCFLAQPLSPYYNSNSYISGLLRASDVTLPIGPALKPLFYVGWFKPVPAPEFTRRFE